MSRRRQSRHPPPQALLATLSRPSAQPVPRLRLNHRLNRPTGRYATTLLSGRPYRPPNHLREACKLLRVYVRLAERDRKRNPHLYPSPQQQLRELEQERFNAELQQALDRVYGPTDPPNSAVTAGRSPPVDLARNR